MVAANLAQSHCVFANIQSLGGTLRAGRCSRSTRSAPPIDRNGGTVALFAKREVSSAVERIDAVIQDSFEGFEFNGEDTWVGRNGSTLVFIRADSIEETSAVVHVDAVVAHDLAITPNLCYDLLVNHQHPVGRWEVEVSDPTSGRGAIMLGTDIIDHHGSMDASEISIAIGLIAQSADAVDDELAAKYGGKTAVT